MTHSILRAALAGSALIIASSCERARPVLVADDSPHIQRETSPILIGEIGSMTGANPSPSLAAHRGSTLALEEINSHDGIAGRLVQASAYDDQGRPSSARRAAQRLEEDESAVAILIFSREASLAAAREAAQKTPLVAPILEGARPLETRVAGFDAHFRARFGIDPDDDAFRGYAATHWLALALGRARTYARGDVDEALRSSARDSAQHAGFPVHVEGTHVPVIVLGTNSKPVHDR